MKERDRIVKTVSIDDQIKAVKREISMREHVYARRVMNGTMTQSKADHEMAAMRAVLETLERVKKLDEPQLNWLDSKPRKGDRNG